MGRLAARWSITAARPVYYRVRQEPQPRAGGPGGEEPPTAGVPPLRQADNCSTLDEERFFGLMQAMLNLIGTGAASK